MAACDHLGLHDGDFWGPGTYFLPTHYTLCVILFMMQVATHPIVEIALLKELKDPILAFFCRCCRKKPTMEIQLDDSPTAEKPGCCKCCGYGDEDSSDSSCIFLLSVINTALLKDSDVSASSSESSKETATAGESVGRM